MARRKDGASAPRVGSYPYRVASNCYASRRRLGNNGPDPGEENAPVPVRVLKSPSLFLAPDPVDCETLAHPCFWNTQGAKHTITELPPLPGRLVLEEMKTGVAARRCTHHVPRRRVGEFQKGGVHAGHAKGSYVNSIAVLYRDIGFQRRV